MSRALKQVSREKFNKLFTNSTVDSRNPTAWCLQAVGRHTAQAVQCENRQEQTSHNAHIQRRESPPNVGGRYVLSAPTYSRRNRNRLRYEPAGSASLPYRVPTVNGSFVNTLLNSSRLPCFNAGQFRQENPCRVILLQAVWLCLRQCCFLCSGTYKKP